jgi:hypothetical protein
MTTKGTVWGLMVEFQSPEELLVAVRHARSAGYRQMDAYTPYPVEGLATELGMRRSRIPSIVLIGGLIGVAVGFWMQYYSLAIDYRINAGGRPYNSWPVFIPIAFELTILVAACSAFLGMLFLNRLPQPHHPLFNVPQFDRASQDRFFICIEAGDPLFDIAATTSFLAGLVPQGEVLIVPETEPTEDEFPAVTIEIHSPARESVTTGSG